MPRKLPPEIHPPAPANIRKKQEQDAGGHPEERRRIQAAAEEGAVDEEPEAEVRTHIPDQGQGIPEGAGAKEDPGEIDQEEGDGPLQEAEDFGGFRDFQLFPDFPAEGPGDLPGDLVQAVKAAPDDIGKAGAVPQAADQENNQDVPVFPEFPFAASAEGNIQVIPEPGGQGDMPPAPEGGHRG